MTRFLQTATLTTVAAAALIQPAFAAPMPATTAKAVLEAYHTAVGQVPASGTAVLEYNYSGNGLTGTGHSIIDLHSGAFLESVQADIVGEAHGYDGKTPWMRDTSGANTAQEGGDRIALAVNEAYRQGNLWWRPNFAGAMISYTGLVEADPDHGAKRSFDQLSITPEGGKTFQAWFDTNTHLLAEIHEDRGFFHTRTLFEDYRPEKGRAVAHRITLDNGDGEAGYEHFQLSKVTIGPDRPTTAWSRPMAPPTGGRIEDGAASVSLPFRLLNNHIYVDVMVNGKGPYTFIVDTGGHCLIAPDRVAQLGLKIVGAAPMSGAGDKIASTGFTHIDDIALGSLHMRDQLGFAAPIYDPSIEGIRVDGMVGFEVFRRFAVQIDYGRHVITLTDPARFDPKDSGTAIPFVFYDHLPSVSGLIDDLPAHFDIDTGSRAEADITSPFVAANNLRSRFSKGVTAVTGWGVGGPSHSYVVRLPSLTLGSVRVNNPVVGLSQDKGGSISDPNYAANVGSGFLKRFVVTFDYAHQRMYLKPVDPPQVDVGQFDRAGMWINSKADGYLVTDVSAQGPAARAGIQVGDVISRLDGQAPKFDELSQARTLLRSRPAGTSLAVELKRGTEVKQVTLVLEDQI
jgi:Aspartyl protease/PDZ domain